MKELASNAEYQGEMRPRRWRRRASEGAAWLITFVALPALVILALLLPPVRLLDRLQAFTITHRRTGSAVQDADGVVSFG